MATESPKMLVYYIPVSVIYMCIDIVDITHKWEPPRKTKWDNCGSHKSQPTSPAHDFLCGNPVPEW